jgi:hypothetical protein
MEPLGQIWMVLIGEDILAVCCLKCVAGTLWQRNIVMNKHHFQWNRKSWWGFPWFRTTIFCKCHSGYSGNHLEALRATRARNASIAMHWNGYGSNMLKHGLAKDPQKCSLFIPFHISRIWRKQSASNLSLKDPCLSMHELHADTSRMKHFMQFSLSLHETSPVWGITLQCLQTHTERMPILCSWSVPV